MTCYLFFLLSGTVNFLDSSSSFKSLIAHIDQLANHRGRLIYTLHKKSTSDRPCIHGSAWGRQFRQYVGKNSHTAITLRREQRCTEGTVLGDWHCTRQLRFFRNPKKTKSSTPPPPQKKKSIELFSVHKQAQQSLFQTLDLSASLFFCRLLSTVRVPFAKRNISVQFLQILLVLLFVCFVFVLFCFEGGYNIMMSYINATFVLMKTKKPVERKTKAGVCLWKKKLIIIIISSPFFLPFLACLSPLSLYLPSRIMET